jgi:hypothetical protein
MGNSLSADILRAFRNEIEQDDPEFEKNAVKFKALREVATRLGSPMEGMRKGWSMLSPTKLMREGGRMGEGLSEATARTTAARTALEGRKAVGAEHGGKAIKGFFTRKPVVYRGDTMLGRARAHAATKLRAGEHLAPGAKVAPGIKGRAEGLSRSGWTGEGAVTKYLPVGQKGMTAAGAAMSAPGVYDAATKPYDPNRGGLGEQLGGLAGFTLPAVMFGGMPSASFVAPMMGMLGGGALGKKLDVALNPKARAHAQAQREAEARYQQYLAQQKAQGGGQ